jgi:hypothetical protein
MTWRHCEVCGQDYDKAFEVVTAGNRHVFDIFDSAIRLLAPICEHCGCRIVGHGIEVRKAWYWTMAIAASRAGTSIMLNPLTFSFA